MVNMEHGVSQAKTYFLYIIQKDINKIDGKSALVRA